MKKIKLTKLSDDYFNGNHPNGVNTGYEKIGFELNPPKLGERYYVLANNKLDRYPFSTSIVTSLPDKDGVFKTTYSTYRVEYI